MLRRLVLVALLVVSVLPVGAADAKIDMSCTAPTATSAIAGVVKNALGQALSGMKVELYRTNSVAVLPEADDTDGNGRYLICAGQASGAGHDTYDVHVRDLHLHPLYAGVAQPYTTFTNLTGDADFTPESGLPMLYLLNLSITPAEISTAAGPATVQWIVRSKAPSNTTMRLELDHTGVESTLAFFGTEGGGPASGGWNVWKHTATFNKLSTERLYWATARGLSGTKQITQMDHQPYVIDNKAPLFGRAGSGAEECGPGVYANPISPGSPPGTTNPQPVVVHGVCDHWSNGARSGLDAFSLSGVMCLNSLMTLGCTVIDPVLSTNNIVWWPETPLAMGTYYLRWTITDKAGNTATNPIAFPLTITNTGGQKPTVSALSPANLGSGNTFGIVVGSGLTTPTSYPTIGFKANDADGQLDLVPGSLRVRVYYGDERTLVYDYDPTKGPNEYDIVSKKGGASFDLSTGSFRATGYPLNGKQPGRYLATAQITDHGGNTASATWHWILLGAA